MMSSNRFDSQGPSVSSSMDSLSQSQARDDESIFVCKCGVTTNVKGVSKHFSECPDMKKKYSKLFMDIDKLVTKEAESVQDWQNIKVMFTFLEGHIKMMINKEKRKPTHFKNKKSQEDEIPSLKKKSDDEIVSSVNDEFEKKLDESSNSQKNNVNYFEKIKQNDNYEEEK